METYEFTMKVTVDVEEGTGSRHAWEAVSWDLWHGENTSVSMVERLGVDLLANEDELSCHGCGHYGTGEWCDYCARQCVECLTVFAGNDETTVCDCGGKVEW